MSLARSAVFLTVLAMAGAPRASSAQTLLWTESSTIGYGVTAGSLALAACWSGCSLESAGVFILASGVAGLVGGNRIGASAERAAREGRLTSRRRWAARFGTVTGFAGAGTLLAALWINETEGNAEGEDERLLRDWTLIGGATGVVAEVLQERALGSAASASVAVSRRPTGALGLGLRLSAP
jgi:hypothetical protein